MDINVLVTIVFVHLRVQKVSTIVDTSFFSYILEKLQDS